MNPQPDSGIYAVVRRYADAWAANDLPAIVDCYHEEVVFHYFGRSPLAGTHWTRSGTQDGVGEVTLCDMPTFLHQHDQAHVAEIEQWRQHVLGSRPDA